MFRWIWELLFLRPSPVREARDQLAKARMDLLQAEHCLEHYSSTVPMLQLRISRLETYLDDESNKIVEMRRRA